MDRHSPLRLNLGCGRDVREGWVNVDVAAGPGVDLVCDLDRVREQPIGLPDDAVEAFLLSHVLEHIRDPLGLMAELWRLAAPEATATVRLPHGASDDAWEDPTHVRPYFPGSFGYFAQPTYWRADYGYRADWQPEKVQLVVDAKRTAGLTPQDVYARVRAERNWVREMVCELRAVKPARAARRELQANPRIELVGLDVSQGRAVAYPLAA